MPFWDWFREFDPTAKQSGLRKMLASYDPVANAHRASEGLFALLSFDDMKAAAEAARNPAPAPAAAEPAPDPLQEPVPKLPSLGDEAIRRAMEASRKRAFALQGAQSTFLTGTKGIAQMHTLKQIGLVGK